MKRIKQLLLLVITIALVSGCKMKAEVDMAINKDKSVDVSLIEAMDDELIEAMLSTDESTTGVTNTPAQTTQSNTSTQTTQTNSNNQTTQTKKVYTDEEKWAFIESSFKEENEGEDSLEKSGFKAEKYDQDGFKGYKYTKSVKSIDDITGDKAISELDDPSDLTSEKLFVKKGDTYSFKLKMDTQSTSGLDMDEEELKQYGNADLSSIIDGKFVVTLPTKPISHNATSVSKDGKTLTWDLMKQDAQAIEFEFAFEKSNNMMLYIGIGAAIVIVLLIIIIIASKKKKKNNTMPQPMNNVMPQTNIGLGQTAMPVNGTPNVGQPATPVMNQPMIQPQPQMPTNPMMNQPIVQPQPVAPATPEMPTANPMMGAVPTEPTINVEAAQSITQQSPAAPTVEANPVSQAEPVPATPVVPQMPASPVAPVAETPQAAPVSTPVTEAPQVAPAQPVTPAVFDQQMVNNGPSVAPTGDNANNNMPNMQ